MKPPMPLVVLPLLLAAACATHEPTPSELDPTEATSAPAAAEPPRPVELVAVVTSRVSKVIAVDFDGGKLTKVDIRNGQTVHQGQIVAQLDTTELQSQLDKALAERQSA